MLQGSSQPPRLPLSLNHQGMLRHRDRGSGQYGWSQTDRATWTALWVDFIETFAPGVPLDMQQPPMRPSSSRSRESSRQPTGGTAASSTPDDRQGNRPSTTVGQQGNRHTRNNRGPQDDGDGRGGGGRGEPDTATEPTSQPPPLPSGPLLPELAYQSSPLHGRRFFNKVNTVWTTLRLPRLLPCHNDFTIFPCRCNALELLQTVIEVGPIRRNNDTCSILDSVGRGESSDVCLKSNFTMEPLRFICWMMCCCQICCCQRLWYVMMPCQSECVV